MMISDALAATSRPEYRDIRQDWVVETAEVLSVGFLAPPYLRLFAAEKSTFRWSLATRGVARCECIHLSSAVRK